MPRKTKAVFDKLDRKIAPEEFHLASVRAGDIPGTHVIGFDSSADTIELKHAARNRQGFALGALMAAEWLKGKKGFFSIDDFMDSIIGKK
jgi:4-hydroxy-tetrahydrodipicolinate reductase